MTFISQNLKSILNYIGWGDPNPILLFVGIEETKPFESLEDIETVRGKTIIPVEEKVKTCERYSIPIAKILAYLSGERDYYRYCLEKLFRKESGVANINLYPLGKENLKTQTGSRNLPKLFGKIVNFEELYKAYIKANRFPLIRGFVENTETVKAVVCYGKTHWEDFALVFELYREDKFQIPIRVDKDVLVFKSKRERPLVILMPHVSSRNLSDKKLEKIAKTIEEFGVKLP